MSHVRWFLCNAVIVGLCACLVACSGGGGLITGMLPTNVTVALKPNAVQAGTIVMGVVTVSPAAPAGGFKVILSSDNTMAVTIPAGAAIVIPAGATSANFTVNTVNVTAQATANISAVLIPAANGTSTSAMLTVDPPTTAKVQSPLLLSQTTVKGGQPITGTVTLSAPSVNGPAAVLLTSSNPGALAFPPSGGGPAASPGSVQVPIGNTMESFQITTFPVAAQTVVTITATLNNMVIAMVTVTP